MKLALKITAIFILFAYSKQFAYSQSGKHCPLIPLPQKTEKVSETFLLTDDLLILYDDTRLSGLACFLQNELLKHVNITSRIDNKSSCTKAHRIVLSFSSDQKNEEEFFSLRMNKEEVRIKGADKHGVYNGIMSFVQLARLSEKKSGVIMVPCWNLEDYPRFKWRGIMLDESRHFFGKAKVKQLLDWMSLYKLNRFHWHLTDEPGWRIEIKKYPKLAYVGGIGCYSNSNTEATYYTQEDIKEIVRYASERFIEIIPEIDMPGHAAAANRAYPEYSGGGSLKYPDFTFNPGKDSTYGYLTNIIKEVDVLFPSQIIHLGGDEVHYGNENWNKDKFVQKLMTKKKLKTLKDVENYFFQRMSDSLSRIGNKVAAWDEVADSNLSPENTIVFYWRDTKPEQLQKALNKGFPVVLCPRHPMYFDYVQDTLQVYGPDWKRFSFNSYEKVYTFSPSDIQVSYPATSQLLGVQANLWTERIWTERRLDYMLFPRMAALAETAWTLSENKNLANFSSRLKMHFMLYKQDNIYYSDPFNPKLTGEPVN